MLPAPLCRAALLALAVRPAATQPNIKLAEVGGRNRQIMVIFIGQEERQICFRHQASAHTVIARDLNID